MLAYLRKASRKAADRGATAVEYGLLVAAIAAVIVAVVFGLGTVVKNTFNQTTTCINTQGANGAAPAGGGAAPAC